MIGHCLRQNHGCPGLAGAACTCSCESCAGTAAELAAPSTRDRLEGWLAAEGIPVERACEVLVALALEEIAGLDAEAGEARSPGVARALRDRSAAIRQRVEGLQHVASARRGRA